MTAQHRPRARSLILELTARCNHACSHCYNVWHTGPSLDDGGESAGYPAIAEELDTATLLQALDSVLDGIACTHVSLSGGEPLLREDLPQIVDHLARRGVAMTLISNGHLLTEARVVDLLARGVGLFEIPLLSHRRETHDALSGAAGAFDAALAAMAHLRTHRGRFVAAFVVTSQNVADLEGAMKLAMAFGASGLMLNRFNVGGRGRRDATDLLPPVENLRQALRTADRLGAAHGLPVFSAVPIPPCVLDTRVFPHIGFGWCAVSTPDAYYALDPVGNLRPCNHSPTILGNVLDEPIVDLLHSTTMRVFAAALPAVCQPCQWHATCRGGCRAAAESAYGTPKQTDPFVVLSRRDEANTCEDADRCS